MPSDGEPSPFGVNTTFFPADVTSEQPPSGSGRSNERIPLNGPFAALLASHRIAAKRAVAFINVAIVDLIGHFFVRQLCAYLRTGQLPEVFFGSNSDIESNDTPDAVSTAMKRLTCKLANLVLSHFLQALRHIWYSVLHAGPA